MIRPIIDFLPRVRPLFLAKNDQILKSALLTFLCPYGSRDVVKLPLESFLSANNTLIKDRLQAVPFWIVERSREIAQHEKTGANERRGAWGEA